MSCCPCGFFKVRSRETPTSSEKYRITSDDVIRQDDVTKHDDDDDEKGIVPLEEDTNIQTSRSDDIKDFTSRFHAVADSDGEVNAWQLKEILTEVFTDIGHDQFDLDICRSMVAIFDNNLSGKISYQEASILYNQLLKWKEVYKSSDVDGKGFINGGNLHELIQALGYKVDPKSVQAMVVRYSNKEKQMSFVDFISCMIKFTSMYEAYSHKQTSEDRSFTADEFIQLTMYS